ncbi:MAG: hypothetical protein ACD_58C00010G0014 [uncultured bacterium]|nr:MAG: hypothetical protein ACD_58C00010G0014 [uncultured bacterium]
MINQIIKEVEKYLKGRSDSHDIEHCHRVAKIAREVAKDYNKADTEIIIAGCYLHDVGYTKASYGHPHCVAGVKIAQDILEKIGYSQDKIDKICEIVLHHEDSKFGIKYQPNLETRIVQDADAIDGFGAVGLSRFFQFAGSTNMPLWIPSYKKEPKIIYENISIIHNIEAVIKYAGEICTTKLGKKLFKYRLKVMKSFVKEFKKEWTTQI